MEFEDITLKDSTAIMTVIINIMSLEKVLHKKETPFKELEPLTYRELSSLQNKLLDDHRKKYS